MGYEKIMGVPHPSLRKHRLKQLQKQQQVENIRKERKLTEGSKTELNNSHLAEKINEKRTAKQSKNSKIAAGATIDAEESNNTFQEDQNSSTTTAERLMDIVVNNGDGNQQEITFQPKNSKRNRIRSCERSTNVINRSLSLESNTSNESIKRFAKTHYSRYIYLCTFDLLMLYSYKV